MCFFSPTDWKLKVKGKVSVCRMYYTFSHSSCVLMSVSVCWLVQLEYLTNYQMDCIAILYRYRNRFLFPKVWILLTSSHVNSKLALLTFIEIYQQLFYWSAWNLVQISMMARKNTSDISNYLSFSFSAFSRSKLSSSCEIFQHLLDKLVQKYYTSTHVPERMYANNFLYSLTFPLVHQLVHNHWFKWNMTTIGWIAMTFGSDIHVSLRMNCNHFDDTILWFLNKHLNNYSWSSCLNSKC